MFFQQPVFVHISMKMAEILNVLEEFLHCLMCECLYEYKHGDMPGE